MGSWYDSESSTASDDKWDETKPGIAKFGGVLIPMRSEYNSPNRLHLHSLQGFPAALAVGTPGIIWDVDDGTVVFVAFDGGRYEMSVTEGKVVEPGIGPQASWPPPLQHALIDVDNIRALAKGNAVAPKVGTDIEATDDGWFNCFNDVWKKTKPDLDKVEASQAPANDKYGRLGGIRKSAELSAPKTCEPEEEGARRGAHEAHRGAERRAARDLREGQAQVQVTGLGSPSAVAGSSR